MEKAFEIINLNKAYKGFALKNVSLSLPKGYIMGFVGKNGAGKSTTMNCLLGITKADSGVLKIFDKDIGDLTAADKEKIGVVLDGCPFAEILTVKSCQKMSCFSEASGRGAAASSIRTGRQMPTPASMPPRMRCRQSDTAAAPTAS